VRTARKHIGWYVKTLPGGEAFRARMNLLEDCQAQLQAVSEFFDSLGDCMDRIPASADGQDVSVHLPVNNDKKKEEAAL
jgi:tRNA-dihydrouridine synthase B